LAVVASGTLRNRNRGSWVPVRFSEAIYGEASGSSGMPRAADQKPATVATSLQSTVTEPTDRVTASSSGFRGERPADVAGGWI
jgi:hypothetical protein